MDKGLEALADTAGDLATRPVCGPSTDDIVAGLTAITAAECQLAAAKATPVRD